MRGSRPNWTAWRVSENAPVITAWLAMTWRRSPGLTIGISAHSGKEPVERVIDSGGMGQDQRALAEIVEHKARAAPGQPGELDRPAAEVAEIGIERLAAGHRQEDRAQRHEADQLVRR